MLGKTHRVGGTLCVLGGFALLKSRGMLLGDVNPLIQLTVMYPFSIYGSTVSDLDHDWHSCPSKDVVSYAINKILHLASPLIDCIGEKSPISKVLSIFDAKHRSWQTHSDLTLLGMIWLMNYFVNTSVTSADAVILRLVFTGLIMGVISHLILDMLTPEGIWCFSTVILRKITKKKIFPEKISLVPNSKFYRTGGAWETLVRKVLWVLCIIFLLKILMPFTPYGVTFLKG